MHLSLDEVSRNIVFVVIEKIFFFQDPSPNKDMVSSCIKLCEGAKKKHILDLIVYPDFTPITNISSRYF